MREQFSGRKLRAERIKARMSIENLASCCGVDSEIISELESGTRRPRGAMQLTLADALGVRLQAFYSEDLSE
ncbi:MAG: helix-turn-helix transcriptional regulator [Rubrobacteraceae bacterium]